MGIDYGARRVGVALSDKDGVMAFPKAVLSNDKTLFRDLEEFIEGHNIQVLVVGESRNYKGEKNDIMDSIERFIKEVQRRFEVEVIFEPEFLTSHQVSKMNPGAVNIDASAAAIILQAYLDRERKV